MYVSRIIEQQLERALENNKVLFILGARQVGKTTLIEQILQKKGGNLLNMDIEVDRARLLSAAKLSPEDAVAALSGGSVLVIDEAQRVPEIGTITKGWYDAGVAKKIVLLGSSTVTLLDNAAAELTGRNEKLWLTPFLIQEVLSQQPWYHEALPAPDLHRDFAGQIRSLLLRHLVYGTYPESFTTADPEQYLTNLSSDYLLKDIFTSSAVRSPEDVKRLLLELASEIGETVTVSQLATRLSLSRPTVQKYLDLLEAIFVIFSIPAYYTDGEKEVTKSTKYYFWDTRVKNALQREWVVSEHRSDINQLWENWVMAEIVKQGKTFNRHEDLYFWENRNGSSVDLVVKQGTQLHPFDMQFTSNQKRPSKAFYNTYGKAARQIHPDNILEVVL